MSLDVYLELDEPIAVTQGSGIFIRENGQNKEISLEEWQDRFPDANPIVIKPTTTETKEVYSANITHNLTTMADKCGVYELVWRPDENGIFYANQLIEPLMKGIADLKTRPEYFKKFNPKNNWGSYEGFLQFLEEYLDACIHYPKAKVSVWR